MEAFKLLVFSRPVTLSSFDVRHCRGQRCCYRPFCLNIPTLYPRPFNRHHYGGRHLQIQTGSLHFNVWYSGITSTDQPCRTRKTYNSGVPRCMFLNNQASRVQGNLSYFSPILHHATHLLPQPRYTYVDLVAVTHDFLKTPLMPSPGS